MMVNLIEHLLQDAYKISAELEEVFKMVKERDTVACVTIGWNEETDKFEVMSNE